MKFDLNAPNPHAPFRKVPPLVLENTLKERLPHASHVYNMMIMSSTPDSGINFYTLNGLNCPTCWIVATYLREDKGMEYVISTPLNPEITSEIKEAFRTSALFDWTQKSCFYPALERKISSMICEISICEKNRETLVSPSLTFWMDRNKALLLDTSTPNSNVVAQPINDEGQKLLLANWKYAQPNSDLYLQKMTQRYPSAGVFVDGRAVSGTIFKSHGALGALHTKDTERNKGYGKVCMNFMAKSLAEKQFIPCSHVEVNNKSSVAITQKLGFTLVDPSYFVDFIFIT